MAKLVLTSRTSARQALPPAFYLLFTSTSRDAAACQLAYRWPPVSDAAQRDFH